MKLMAFVSLLFSMNLFAGELSFRCNKLINGNANGKAYTTGKSVDFELRIDERGEDAEARGTLVTKAGAYHREDEVENLYYFFTDGRKFDRKGDVVTVTSFERNVFLCGIAMGTPCRRWEALTFNLKTNEGVLEKYHAMKLVLGEIVYEQSIKFTCSK